MKLVAATANRNCHPKLVIRIYHVGKNDYRVVAEGIGEYARTTQLGYASQHASHLASLDAVNLAYTINQLAA